MARAEEELVVQQDTSAVYPTGRVPALFELEDTQRSWISLFSFLVVVCGCVLIEEGPQNDFGF